MNKFYDNSIGKLMRLVRHLSRQKIGMHAAAAGYFIVLSIFPLLVLMLALLRYTGLEVNTLSEFIANFLPDALAPAVRILGLRRSSFSASAVAGILAPST